MFNKLHFLKKNYLKKINLSKILVIFAISYSLCSIIIYTFSDNITFAFIGIKKLIPVYGDLRSITYSSECGKDIISLRSEYINCDIWQRPFNYPRLILDIFKYFKLEINNTEIIGGIYGLTFLSGLFLFNIKTYKKNTDINLISFLCIFSYPFQLVVERGNYDSIIFLLLISLPFLIYEENNFFKFLFFSFGLFLIYLSISLKIYPLLGIISWAILNSFQKLCNRKIFNFVKKEFIIILTSIFAFCITLKNNSISLIINNTTNPDGYSSFGFLSAFQNDVNSSTYIIFILIKVSLIFFTTKNIFNHLSFKNDYLKYLKNIDSVVYQSGILFSYMHLSIYFLFSSYDYRMIFVFGFIPFIREIWEFLPKKIIFINLRFIPYMAIFILFQQYLPSSFDVVTTYISDIILQPICIGILVGINLNLIFGNLNKKKLI